MESACLFRYLYELGYAPYPEPDRRILLFSPSIYLTSIFVLQFDLYLLVTFSSWNTEGICLSD